MNLPVIILITLLPISISGIGVRESAFIWFFGLAGIAAEKSDGAFTALVSIDGGSRYLGAV